MTILRAVAACLVMTPAAAHAGMPIEVEKTCPVGGETFRHVETASYSTFGSRPDGRPYGSWYFPMPIAECPENALVMYRNFEEDEIAELTRLVLSDAYQAMRGETTYYRASWLEERMQSTASLAPVFLMMRAAWQVDEAPEVKTRYQTEFAQRGGNVPVIANDLDTLFLRFRVANALRETGQFADAASSLSTIPTASLEVTVPERDGDNYNDVDEAEARLFLLSQIEPLRLLIEAGDTSSEPLSMIPPRMAEYRCYEIAEEDSADLPELCLSDEMQERIAEIRESRAD
ncbi:MAG: hypothetical protein ABJN35_01450 [Erythrobacter sp.]